MSNVISITTNMDIITICATILLIVRVVVTFLQWRLEFEITDGEDLKKQIGKLQKEKKSLEYGINLRDAKISVLEQALNDCASINEGALLDEEVPEIPTF